MQYVSNRPASSTPGQRSIVHVTVLHRVIRPLMLLCLALLGASTAHAGMAYQTGFESPSFTAGPVAGQDGWVGDGAIQTGVVASGSQAFHLGADVDGFFEGYKTVNRSVGGGVVSLTVDFMRRGDGLNFTGISLWADTGFLGQIMALDISEVQLGNADSNAAPIAFTEGVWHALRLDLDLDAQTLSGSIDGTSLGTLALNPAGGPAGMITDIAFYGWGSADGQDMYYDNLALFGDFPVPLPTTLALLGLGLVGMLVQGRQRR